MKKVSVPATNNLCPQTLVVYGTMNEDKIKPDVEIGAAARGN